MIDSSYILFLLMDTPVFTPTPTSPLTSSAPLSSASLSPQAPLRSSRLGWYLSIVLLISVIAGTVGLSLWNTRLSTQISALKTEITNKEETIRKSHTDKTVLLATILRDTTKIRPSIDVAARLQDFQTIARDAGVRFQGFSIRDDQITTTLIADTSLSPRTDPVDRVIALIRARSADAQTFSLDPIRGVSGDLKKRTTPIVLTMLPPGATGSGQVTPGNQK